MRRQASVDEVSRQRRDRAIRLLIGEALRHLTGDPQLVAGIEQRQFARLARKDAPKQRVERRRCRDPVPSPPASISPARPAVATSLPADPRSVAWLWAV